MRIHTTATFHDMVTALRLSDTRGDKLEEHNSKTRPDGHGYEVILSGRSKRRQNGGGNFAATWDQWGIFLAHIYSIDPLAKCWAYENVIAFNWQTNYRFAEGGAVTGIGDSHGDHTFRYTGVPCEQTCTKCDAVRRWTF